MKVQVFPTAVSHEFPCPTSVSDFDFFFDFFS